MARAEPDIPPADFLADVSEVEHIRCMARTLAAFGFEQLAEEAHRDADWLEGQRSIH